MLLLIVIIVATNTPDKNQLAIKINVPLNVLRTARGYYGEDYPLYLTRLAIENNFNWDSLTASDYAEVQKLPKDALKRVYQNNPSKDISMIYKVYNQAYSSIEYFPIPNYVYEYEVTSTKRSSGYKTIREIKEYSYSLYNDFGSERNYKEQTKHEGNDLVANPMTALVSITDGKIDKIGWNEHGGYRIGIKTKEGAYFYYAHMEQYAEGLYKGKKINAGDHIGYVGDTGYGPEGTEGKFINHLHFQIGIDLGDDYDKEYFWINTYDILKLVEHDVVIYAKDGVTSSSIANDGY
jgi:murein DD-endopeptidase MepM/ murein hydrolase activator NlpD